MAAAASSGSKTLTAKRNQGGAKDTAKRIKAIVRLAQEDPDAYSPAGVGGGGATQTPTTAPAGPAFGAAMAAAFQ